MDNKGQLEVSPAGILCAVVGAGIMWYMMSSTDVNWFFKLMGIPLGGVAGLIVGGRVFDN